MTTLTATDLREYIIGAWTLESYQSSALDGSDVRYPLGADARGIIMYTPDGYMSAQIMRAGRPEFQVGDLTTADKDELATAASGYLAYSGPYSVADGILAHHVDISLFPNWIGGTQYRAAQIGDSRLELSPTEPVLIDGRQPRMGRLVWRRAHPSE